jgi:hypothetical protein
LPEHGALFARITSAATPTSQPLAALCITTVAVENGSLAIPGDVRHTAPQARFTG